MHILILGAYQSCNLGDAVICECVAEQLRRAWPEARITLRDPVARDRLAPKAVPEEAMLRRRALLARARRKLARMGIDRIRGREERRVRANLTHLEQVCTGDYDLAVFAGGQLFMDSYGLFLEKCVELLDRKNIPVIFHACGMGPLYSPAIEKRLSAALRRENVIAVSVRDGLPRAEALLGGPVKAVSDPALAAAELFGVRAGASDLVGLGVMYPNGSSYRGALNLWRQIIGELNSRGVRWQLFTNGDPADEVFACRILEDYPDREARIAPRNVTAEGLLETVAGYKAVLSYRLHSQILAASLDIPAAALVWDEKQRHFFGSIGCPERCFDPAADARALVKGLETAAARGYDRKLLERQAAESRRWLLDAVERGLTR